MKKLFFAIFCFLHVILNGQSPFAIKNVHIISMTSTSVLSNQTILIRNGIIESIGDAKKIIIPKNYTLIDGKEKYLLPGFINMYTHVNESNLMLYLANGQTTVRDIPSHINVLGLREQVKKGERLGPRILSYGLRATGAPAPFHSQQPIFTAEEGRRQVREAKRLGYDGMMIYATCAPATYEAILEEAERMDLPISGHFPIFIDEEVVLNSQQPEFDNLTGLTRRGRLSMDSQKLISYLKKQNKAITPSLAVHYIWSLSHKKDSLYHSSLMNYVPPKQKANWKPEKRASRSSNTYPYENVASLIKELSDNEIQLFLGSDGGYPLVVPGFAYLDEMELFAKAGISNFDILKYATIDAAQFLELKDVGTIEVGKKAELVILSENPLLNIKNVRKIEGIMIANQWLEKSFLEKELNLLKQNIDKPKNRFRNWETYLKKTIKSHELNYTFYTEEYEVGQQKFLIDTLENKTITIRSVMVADAPDFRATYSFHRIQNNRVDSLFILNNGSEGKTEVSLSLKNDTVSIKGFSPFHGQFEYKKFAPIGTQLWNPFISRYFELDNLVNYHLALSLSRKLDIEQANQFKSIQIELNSEEYGEKYIIDESMTTIYKTNENEYRIIYPGFSGFPNRTSLPFNIKVKTDNSHIIQEIEYQNHKIIYNGNKS